MNRKYIIIVVFLFLFVWFMTVYLSGFEGYVLDSVSGEPIKDAYIVTTISLYPWNQLCNLGGPNSEFIDIYLARSNNLGRFRIAPFFILFAGFLDYRDIYIYKNGYYLRRFLQYSRTSIYENIYPETKKARLSSYDGAYLFYLLKESEKSAGISQLLWQTEICAWHSEHVPSRFKKQLPIFYDLYKLFKAETDQVNASSWPSEMKGAWKRKLDSLESYFERTPNN